MKFATRGFRVAFCLLTLCHLPACSKKDPVAEANLFFDLLNKGETKTAYDRAAFAFQAQQTAADFRATAKEQGFANFKSLTWTRSSVADSEASLEGDLVTGSDAKAHVKAKFIRESGEWKLFSMQTSGGEQVLPRNPFSLFGRSTGLASVAHPPLPADSELKKMIRETLLKFNDAVARADFGEFYESLSRTWRNQLTQKRLAAAFQPFVEAKVDLSEIRNLEPIFSEEPRIDPDGLLFLNGFYQLKQHRLTFTLKYIYELPAWKLFGIDANLTK